MSMLIVDDHEEFRAFAKELLTADGFDVTAEAADGEAALDVFDRCHAAVVLLDVGLPGMDGFEVARRLCERPDPPSVVLTSSRLASDYGGLLAASPARGFVCKQDLSGEAVAALLPR